MEKYFNVNKEGHSIKAKMYLNSIQDVQRIVIFLHGFGGHKDNKAAKRFAEHLLKKHKDFVIITYDAPCHGDDVKKTLRLSDCMTYLRLICEYATERFGTDRLFCHATSFGGYQALKYISENGNIFEKTALRCPAVNMYKVMSGAIMTEAEQRLLKKGKPVMIGFDRKIPVTAGFLEELRHEDIRERDFSEYSETMLIIHGTSDEVVPFSESESFADKNDILFIAAENADHRFIDPVKMDLAIHNTIEFFEL